MWILDGNQIPTPQRKVIKNDVVAVVHRTLDGGFSRDFVGSEKKIFECEYTPISAEDYEVIRAEYEDQRDNGTAKILTISDDDFTFSAGVIISMPEMNFNFANHYNYRNVKINFTEV